MLASALLVPERWRNGTAYNPLSMRMAQNPYPVYAALRERSPAHRSRLLNAWVFTRHTDVHAVLRDHRHFGNDPRKGSLTPRQLAMLPAPDKFHLLFLDPPDHTRLRSLVNSAFGTAAIQALEPRIRCIMDGLLDAIGDPSSFDLINAVARPLPITVIAELLGVPSEDWPRFKVWSARRARMIEPTISPRERRAGAAASREFDAYFRPVIRARRSVPRDDIVSTLARAQHKSDRLSERETLNMLRLLLVAGNETTTNLIGNGMLALLRHPEQLKYLRQDPGLIPGAVEELLRFDAPTQMTFRRGLADCDVNGVAVRKRDNIALLLGAANRDPSVFKDPDRLDVGRNAGAHLSFGRGIHHCLGAHLARLQTRVVLQMLLERFESIEPCAERPVFRRTVVVRGIRSLPVRCVPA